MPNSSKCLCLLSISGHPCLCLCFGFSQITLILPFRLIILHFSQIGFTDDLTFTAFPPFYLPLRAHICLILRIFLRKKAMLQKRSASIITSKPRKIKHFPLLFQHGNFQIPCESAIPYFSNILHIFFFALIEI